MTKKVYKMGTASNKDPSQDNSLMEESVSAHSQGVGTDASEKLPRFAILNQTESNT